MFQISRSYAKTWLRVRDQDVDELLDARPPLDCFSVSQSGGNVFVFVVDCCSLESPPPPLRLRDTSVSVTLAISPPLPMRDDKDSCVSEATIDSLYSAANRSRRISSTGIPEEEFWFVGLPRNPFKGEVAMAGETILSNKPFIVVPAAIRTPMPVLQKSARWVSASIQDPLSFFHSGLLLVVFPPIVSSLFRSTKCVVHVTLV